MNERMAGLKKYAHADLIQLVTDTSLRTASNKPVLGQKSPSHILTLLDQLQNSKCIVYNSNRPQVHKNH